MFSGFPLTVKFVIEWAILGNLILQSNLVFMGVFFIIVVIGVAGFAKQMIIILYGMPRNQTTVNYTLSKRDKYLFYLIIYILVLLKYFS